VTRLTLVDACRACGHSPLVEILSLGRTPLANSLLPADSGKPATFPLTLVRCQKCSLVQIAEIVDPEDLFSDYVYFSSNSETMLAHAAAFTGQLTDRESLGRDSLVVEIASNDGYLLQYLKQRGVGVLGIEPALNIAEFAERENGIPTLARFFDHELARELASDGRCADAILGNNVLAHVPEVHGFVSGVATLLKRSGVAVFEVPYVKDMLDKVEFDTIYHEHQCYFSLTALQHLFGEHGLDVVEVERIPIHGGSIRVSFAPRGARPQSNAVAGMLDEERAWGVDHAEPYSAFAHSVDDLRRQLRTLLDDLEPNRIAAYGAAAKGVTMTSYCDIADRLEYVVDRSPHKQGRRFPVGGIPIYAPDKLLADRPDYALMLTWNFADEILRQQSAYRDAGGKFIVPVPYPRVV
jgi:SAM-dependent methyltransferase